MPRLAVMGFSLSVFSLKDMLSLLPGISVLKHKLFVSIAFSQPPSIPYSSGGRSLLLGMFVL